MGADHGTRVPWYHRYQGERDIGVGYSVILPALRTEQLKFLNLENRRVVAEADSRESGLHDRPRRQYPFPGCRGQVSADPAVED